MCRTPQWSVPPVRLDPLAGLDRDQRGRDHLADHLLGLELALKRIAQGAGLVAGAHLTGRLTGQPACQTPNRRLLIGFLPAQGLRTPRDEHRDVNRLLVCVQPHPSDTVRTHDRLLRMRLWRRWR